MKKTQPEDANGMLGTMISLKTLLSLLHLYLPRPMWCSSGCRDADVDRMPIGDKRHLRALATETTGELDVFALNGDTLGVDSAQVGVFEKRDKVCFNGLLEGADG